VFRKAWIVSAPLTVMVALADRRQNRQRYGTTAIGCPNRRVVRRLDLRSAPDESNNCEIEPSLVGGYGGEQAATVSAELARYIIDEKAAISHQVKPAEVGRSVPPCFCDTV
jgi:hypothetical protein